MKVFNCSAGVSTGGGGTLNLISGVSGQGVQPLLHELLKLVEKQRDPGSSSKAREAA